MKTITEFNSFALKNARAKLDELSVGEKTPEEIQAGMTEALKVEGDKLKMLMAALEVSKKQPEGLKRVIVHAPIGETDKPPAKAQKIDEHYYSIEYYPGAAQPKREERRDERGGRGDRNGKRGGRGGRDGKGPGRGPGQGEGRGRPPRDGEQSVEGGRGAGRGGRPPRDGSQPQMQVAGDGSAPAAEGGQGDENRKPRRRRPRGRGPRPDGAPGQAQAGATPPPVRTGPPPRIIPRNATAAASAATPGGQAPAAPMAGAPEAGGTPSGAGPADMSAPSTQTSEPSGS